MFGEMDQPMEYEHEQDTIRVPLLHLELPEEIWLHIFATYMDTKDLCKVAQVCHPWAVMVRQSQTLWKRMCLSIVNPDQRREALKEHKKGKTWMEAYKDNHGKSWTKKIWKSGQLSRNFASYEEVPANAFSEMNADEWGEIFDREMSR